MLPGIVVGGLVALVVIGWIGLQIKPAPFPAYPQRATTFETVPLPEGLPGPVERYYRTILDEPRWDAPVEVPVIESAVITGTGRLRVMGITFPARLRFTHDAGQGYRHYIEATLFGQPLMKVNERYLDGRGVMELPFGTIENEPKIDSAANLGLWGESIWLPTIFLTDPRVRWEAVDETHARLIVPFADGEEVFTVTFGAETGLITEMEAMRWKDANAETKTRWVLQIYGWKTFNGILLPSPAGVVWEDEGTPWLVVELTDVALNADISAYIRGRGL
ncbi:MAG: hypothetical protein Kow0077_21270 [Anaerolineae bacterium]